MEYLTKRDEALYLMAEKMAIKLIHSHASKISFRNIVCIIRTQGTYINDHLSPSFSRIFIDKYPQYKHLVKTKPLKKQPKGVGDQKK